MGKCNRSTFHIKPLPLFSYYDKSTLAVALLHSLNQESQLNNIPNEKKRKLLHINQ